MLSLAKPTQGAHFGTNETYENNRGNTDVSNLWRAATVTLFAMLLTTVYFLFQANKEGSTARQASQALRDSLDTLQQETNAIMVDRDDLRGAYHQLQLQTDRRVRAALEEGDRLRLQLRRQATTAQPLQGDEPRHSRRYPTPERPAVLPEEDRPPMRTAPARSTAPATTLTSTRALSEPVTTTRTMATQGPTSYTVTMKNTQPRFKPLNEWEQGAWEARDPPNSRARGSHDA